MAKFGSHLDEDPKMMERRIDDLSEPLIEFLLPHIMLIGEWGLKDDFLPSTPDHSSIIRFPVQRALLPFVAKDADLAKWTADLHGNFRKEGEAYHVMEENEEVSLDDEEALFLYLMVGVSVRIIDAWVRQLFASTLRDGTQERFLMPAVHIDSDMLPLERDTFLLLLHEAEIDANAVLGVMRAARKTLDDGEVLPTCLADQFLVSMTSKLN